ncbi:MAG TPA: class I SAM-dependent methyltransferase [Vicinamibacterales bacterium]|nr:class I SAM-dependent methyltransferase [Vicinamibacterales bacterium]
MKWLRARIGRVAAAMTSAVVSDRASILDAYCHAAPGPQNALDVFAGEWASRLPPPHDTLRAGEALLFEDTRLQWAIDHLGGVRGQRVLELGPLEGGHTYMLDRSGAAEVLAIEANTRAFLKCLVIKEIMGLPSSRFVCGDFVSYLRATTDRFDVVVASGVLYHMVHPVEVIARIASISNAVYLWTHYYDEAVLGASPATAHRMVDGQDVVHDGFGHRLHKHEYLTALNQAGFCGGSRPFAYWLTRDDILGALRHFGLTRVETSFEQPDHPNGPAFSVVARR